MLEKELEKKLRIEIEKKGGRLLKFISPGNNGVPDRICVLKNGKLIFVELKKPKGGGYSKIQLYQHKVLRDLGQIVECIKNEIDLQKFIKKYVDEI